MSKDFLDEIYEQLEDFRILEPKESFDDRIIESIEKFKPIRDQLIDYFDLIVSIENDDVYYDQIFQFIEKCLEFYFPPESMQSFNEMWFDNYKFILYEVFLYFIAALLMNKRMDIVQRFATEQFLVNNRFSNDGLYYISINRYLESLDKYRNNRLNLRRLSVEADILSKRADRIDINFENIMQADFVLALLSVFDNSNRYEYWFPRTLVYRTRRNSKPFELFKRAESERHFNSLRELFMIRDKDDLIDKYNRANEKFGLNNWRFDYEHINFEGLMNLEKLFSG